MKFFTSIIFLICLNAHSQNIKRLLKEAKSSYYASSYVSAFNKSQLILKKDSTEIEALAVRGGAYFYLGKNDSAYLDLIKYSKHRQLDSTYFNIWVSLKNYYENKYDPFTALNCSKQALLSKPNETNLTQYDRYAVSSNKELAFTLGGKSHILTQLLKEHHINPAKQDSNYTHQIISNYFNLLDPDHEYFFQSDIDTFQQIGSYLNLDIKNCSNVIYNLTLPLFKTRLHQVDSILLSLKNDSISFEDPELLIQKKSNYFPKNLDSLSCIWKKKIKYDVLNEVFVPKLDSILGISFENRNSLSENDEITQKVIYRSREKIKEKYDHPGGIGNLIESSFLNAITSTYDPHTNYFTPQEASDFEESLSKEEYSFGFTLTREMNHIKIKNILFGSPAWLADEFEENNTIIKIKLKNKDEINLDYYNSYELNEILSKYENDSIEFTLRKKNGEIVIKELVKARIPTENYVRSFILEGKRKIGYVYFPSFYTSSENFKVGCEIDLMNEVLRLENENTEGLILDLRNNGGGSLFEIEYISSMFIDQGKYLRLSVHNSKDIIMEEVPTGVCYKKPMVILVNMYTISAAEALTGILKLYNRAIVVGTNTFGKFTGQNFMPLIPDKVYLQDDEIDKLGYAKITNIKTYMADGTNYQKNGIQPDVQLPFLFYNYISKENGFDNAIQPDTILPLDNFIPLTPLPTDKIIAFSKTRTDSNYYFKLINELNEEFKELNKQNDTLILQFEYFQNMTTRYHAFLNKLDTLKNYKANYNVMNHKSDLYHFKTDKVKSDINHQIIETLQNDMYLNESYMIINDLIDLLETE